MGDHGVSNGGRQRSALLVIKVRGISTKIGNQPSKVMEDLVKDGLGEQIYAYAAEHPYIIKAYREGFPVLMER